MDGVLVIDKAAGPTSHDIVGAVRKLLDEKKVGHTGTLDPAATGVLPLVLGRATKVARYLTGTDKRYEAVIHLGRTTTTLDGEGETLEEKPVHSSEADVRAALAKLTGDIEQLPPMYSAKKVQGKRLYELARQGVEVEREVKKIRVHSIDMLGFANDRVQIAVHCSPGTYVRVLADDLGKLLGCGGYLETLRRTAVGPFVLDHAITLEALAAEPESAVALARARLVPLKNALHSLPRIDVPAEVARMVASGYQLCVADLRTVDTPTFAADEPLTLGIDGGDLVAVARSLVASRDLETMRRDQKALKTERVL